MMYAIMIHKYLRVLNQYIKCNKEHLLPPLTCWYNDSMPVKSRSLRSQSLISRKGATLGPILLLTINRKPNMASILPPSLLTLSDLEK